MKIMGINKILTAILLVCLSACILSAGCTGNTNGNEQTQQQTLQPTQQQTQTDTAAADERITVAASILPQKEIIESVGKDKVKVSILVPPGFSPHTYELTSGQLRSIADTDLFVSMGSGIEFELAWMDKIKGVNPNMPIVNASEGITFIDGYTEEDGTHVSGGDPHVWLSIANAKIMAENVCKALAKESPKDEEYFRANLEEYKAKLDALDGEIRESFTDMKDVTIMTYHPAWSYFVRDYGMECISVENNGKEPSPSDLAALIDTAKAKGIKVIFASPEYSTKSAYTIADAIGGSVVLIDPLSENYIENMKSVAEAFKSAAAQN